MAIIQQLRGTDKTHQFQYLDADGVTPIDLAALDGFIFFLYYNKKNFLVRYATSVILQGEGFKPIVINDAVNGLFSVKLQSAVSKNAKLGFLFPEIKTEVEDVTFDNSTFHDGTADDEAVIELVDSLSKNETNLA